MYQPNLKSVALPLPEIIWGTFKNWAVPEYAHSAFSPKFLMDFCSDGPVNLLAKFDVRIALPIPEITDILGGCCEPQSCGIEGHRGSG